MVRLGSTVQFRLEAPNTNKSFICKNRALNYWKKKGKIMEKFLQMLKQNIKDEIAAYIILGVMVVTFAITIGANEYISYSKLAEVNASLRMAEGTSNVLTNTEAQGVTNELMTNSVIDVEETQKKNEEEFEKLKEEKKISDAADKYYIKVNYGAQVVTVYTKDANGKYTNPVKAMVCSTGTYTPTSGVYRTLGKGNWWGLMGNVYGQYSTWICGDILFHSVPYLEKGDKSSLEYWAYDQLGKRVSMGCVRLTVKDAKWIYDNCPIGTQVEFYASSNPGPLGKPSTMKISDAPSDVRGWDPTDPDKNNPWPEYLKELEEENNKPEKEEPGKEDPGKEDGKGDSEEEEKPEENPNTNEVDGGNVLVNDVVNDIVNDVINDVINDVVINDVINDITSNEIIATN